METNTISQKLQHIQLNLQAPKKQRNKFGNYNYRNAEDIVEAVKPLLKETYTVLTLSDEIVHFPSASQPIVIDVVDDKGKVKKEVIFGDRFYIKSTATLASSGNLQDFVRVDAYAREELKKAGMDAAQITGAASSYARKYALNGLFCIDDTKDPDTTNNHKDSVESDDFEL